jgi:hypothetical protein
MTKQEEVLLEAIAAASARGDSSELRRLSGLWRRSVKAKVDSHGCSPSNWRTVSARCDKHGTINLPHSCKPGRAHMCRRCIPPRDVTRPVEVKREG